VRRAPGATALPDPKDEIETLRPFKRMFARFYAKEYTLAIAEAKAVIAEDPRNLSAWRVIADSLDHQGRTEAAIGTLEEGLRAVGREGVVEEIAQAHEQLAQLVDRTGDHRRCEEILRNALALGLGTEPIRRALAELLVRSGRSREAIETLAAVGPHPEAKTLQVLGRACADAGRIDDARRAFDAALALEPAEAAFLVDRGELALREKKPAEAQDWFQRAIAADPEVPGALVSLGTALAATGDSAGALRCWRSAVERDPRDFRALFNLGVLEGRLGNVEDARRCLERFRREAPRARFEQELAEAGRLLDATRRR
jgi:tetratricopeptide (TPR) repeat protein